MRFADFICFEATIPELDATDRDGAIEALVTSLNKAGKLKRGTAKDVVKAVLDREREASTGIGKGVAVPHVKHTSVKEVVAVVGQSSTGIDFRSLDKQPVFSIILLISPTETPEQHLQAMENIFKNLQQEKFRRFLRQCRTAESIEDLFREADTRQIW
jgi:nitrogen PTS system EIIA component